MFKSAHKLRRVPTMSTDAKTALTTIIIPWLCGQLEFTRQCIAALNRHTRRPWELIVIDNELEKTCTAAPDRSPTCCPVKSAAPIAGPGAPSEARSNVLSDSR
jgi:hypothetical protein